MRCLLAVLGAVQYQTFGATLSLCVSVFMYVPRDSRASVLLESVSNYSLGPHCRDEERNGEVRRNVSSVQWPFLC